MPLSKNVPVGGLKQLDAQALGSHRHLDLILELIEIGDLPNRLLQLFLQLGHVLFGQGEVFSRPGLVRPTFLEVPVGSLKYPPTAS